MGLAAALALAACGSDDSDDQAADATDEREEAAQLVIEDFQFSALTVEPGQAIEVVNRDDAPHTATADDGSFDSGRLAKDESKTITAPDEDGTYALHCEVHPQMTGTLVVGEGGETTTTTAAATGGGAGAVTGSVEAADQDSDGTTVTLTSVTITGASGWIALHQDADGKPGPVVATAPVPEGTTKDLVVKAAKPLATGAYWPMLHVDAGTVGTYEFPGADGPVKSGAEIVMKKITVTVGGAGRSY